MRHLNYKGMTFLVEASASYIAEMDPIEIWPNQNFWVLILNIPKEEWVRVSMFLHYQSQIKGLTFKTGNCSVDLDLGIATGMFMLGDRKQITDYYSLEVVICKADHKNTWYLDWINSELVRYTFPLKLRQRNV